MSLRFSHLYTRGAFWGSGEVWWASHLLSQSVGWNGFLGVGFYLSPTPHALWNGERGPWRRELAQAGPQPAQPGRRELISRLSPRLLPLPFSAPSSLFPSLLPGPAPTRPCQAPCPGGCQAPGGTRRDM